MPEDSDFLDFVEAGYYYPYLPGLAQVDLDYLNLLVYLPVYLLAYLLAYLLDCLPVYLPDCLLAYLPDYPLDYHDHRHLAEAAAVADNIFPTNN